MTRKRIEITNVSKEPLEVDEELLSKGKEKLANLLPTLGSETLTVMERVLVQCVCSECKEVAFKPILAVGGFSNSAALISAIEEQLFNEQFPRRHSSGVFENEKMKEQNLPSGFAFCGYWRIESVWRTWETPTDDNN